MTEDLQRAIILQAHEAEDPVQFWVQAITTIAGFSRCHIGKAKTAELFAIMGRAAQVGVEAEDKH